MNRMLLIVGAAIILIGVFWPWLRRIPLFRLPGDIVYRSGNMTLYFPIVSMVVVSIVVSLLLWLFRK